MSMNDAQANFYWPNATDDDLKQFVEKNQGRRLDHGADRKMKAALHLMKQRGLLKPPAAAAAPGQPGRPAAAQPRGKKPGAGTSVTSAAVMSQVAAQSGLTQAQLDDLELYYDALGLPTPIHNLAAHAQDPAIQATIAALKNAGFTAKGSTKNNALAKQVAMQGTFLAMMAHVPPAQAAALQTVLQGLGVSPGAGTTPQQLNQALNTLVRSPGTGASKKAQANLGKTAQTPAQPGATQPGGTQPGPAQSGTAAPAGPQYRGRPASMKPIDEATANFYWGGIDVAKVKAFVDQHATGPLSPYDEKKYHAGLFVLIKAGLIEEPAKAGPLGAYVFEVMPPDPNVGQNDPAAVVALASDLQAGHRSAPDHPESLEQALEAVGFSRLLEWSFEAEGMTEAQAKAALTKLGMKPATGVAQLG